MTCPTSSSFVTVFFCSPARRLTVGSKVGPVHEVEGAWLGSDEIQRSHIDEEMIVGEQVHNL